jgi:hypothetical protein
MERPECEISLTVSQPAPRHVVLETCSVLHLDMAVHEWIAATFPEATEAAT